jgi:hypothetical protein
LQTEARIIAEDATYAVIALRVDKAFFERNLLLIAALAGLTAVSEKESINGGNP